MTEALTAVARGRRRALAALLAPALSVAVSTLAAGPMLVLPRPARAHDDAYMARLKAPRGGSMRMAGIYHVELLVRGADVRVFLYDHADRPVPAAKTSVRVRFEAGADRMTVALAPSGKADNELAGTASKALRGSVRAVVTLQEAGGPPVDAEYALKLR